MIGVIPTVFLLFPNESLRNPLVFAVKSEKSRDFRIFSSKFSEILCFLQVGIFGLKPYPGGSGAWKQRQRSISKAGLHRIPWFLWPGSLPDVDIPWPSQPSQPEHTHARTHAHTHTPPSPPSRKLRIFRIFGVFGVFGGFRILGIFGLFRDF